MLSVLSKHVLSGPACVRACGVLCNITCNAGELHQLSIWTHNNAENQLIAGREGAIRVVLSVLRKHTSLESVCASACAALHNITANAGVL